MLELSALDQLANRRGDGLTPELRALLGRLVDMKSSDNVTDLASFRLDEIVRAGPNPLGSAAPEAPNIVRLHPAVSDKQAERRKI